MLWMKGWLETRWRLLFALGWGAFALVTASSGNASNAQREITGLITLFAFMSVVSAVMLAGAGINTQSSFRGTKGLHGSMYFTLALPVSRFRLLAIRAAVGLLETTTVIMLICGGLWAAVPALRGQSTLPETLAYGFAIAISTSSFYAVSVLLATFLDGQWQIWGSLIVIGVLRFVSLRLPVPPALDLFRPITTASPLLTHAFPWSGMGLSVAAAAILFCLSVKIVQLREY